MKIWNKQSAPFLKLIGLCTFFAAVLCGLVIYNTASRTCVIVWNHSPYVVKSIKLNYVGEEKRIASVQPGFFSICFLTPKSRGGLSMYFQDKDGETNGLRGDDGIYGSILQIDISAENVATLKQYGGLFGGSVD